MLTMKDMLYLSSTALLLSACGTGGDVDEETIENTVQESETVEQDLDEEETQDKDGENDENESDERNDLNEEEQESEETGSEELSEDDAIEHARRYASEEEDMAIDGLRFTVQDDNEGDYLVQIFEFGTDEDGEETHTATFGWYTVDRQTGEVTNRMDSDPNVYVSELISMTEENRDNHHRNIAANEEDLDEEVLDNLLLPGIHANTVEYQGRVNPTDIVTFSNREILSPEVDTDVDSVDISDREMVEPEIDDKGYFTVDLQGMDLNEGDIATIRIIRDDGEQYSPGEQLFFLTVHEENENMESIRVKE